MSGNENAVPADGMQNVFQEVINHHRQPPLYPIPLSK
jgi:hypothetical protein